MLVRPSIKLRNFFGDEQSYFLLLVDHARAGSADLRNHIHNKLSAIKQRNLEISNRLDRIDFSDKASSIYYSNWLYVAVHIAVAIENLQTIPGLAKHFHVNPSLIETILTHLKKLGLVEQTLNRWKFRGYDIHIPKNSPLVPLHHNNWRQQAILNAQLMKEEDLHYTTVTAMDRSTFESIKIRVLQMIQEVAQAAQPAPSKELVCFATDLFYV